MFGIILGAVLIILLYAFHDTRTQNVRTDWLSKLDRKLQGHNNSIRYDRPALHLAIDGANVFKPNVADMAEFTGICLNARIWNTGTPSTVTDWELVIKTKSNQPEKAQITNINSNLSLIGLNGKILIIANESLALKTESFNVGQIPVRGEILFYTKFAHSDILDADTYFSLRAKDIYGTSLKIDRRIGDWMVR